MPRKRPVELFEDLLEALTPDPQNQYIAGRAATMNEEALDRLFSEMGEQNPGLSRDDLLDAIAMQADVSSAPRNMGGLKEAVGPRHSAPNWVRGSRAPIPTSQALARIPGRHYLGDPVSKLSKFGKMAGKWGGRALGGAGAALSIYAIYEALDQLSGAARKREAFTPDAWADRMGGAADLRETMSERIGMRGEAGQYAHLADASENHNRYAGMRGKAFQQQMMGPSKRSQDKLEELLGSDLETVKQVSQKSPPSFPEFMASEGVI